MPGSYVPSTQPYADPADLYTFGGLSQQALSSPNTGTPAQTACILAASEFVDSFLRQQFALPLTKWGADIRRAVIWIAAYDLICLRGFNPNNAGDENFLTKYKMAVAWLLQVSKGQVSPDVVDSSPGAEVGLQAPNAGPVVTSPTDGYCPPNRGTGRR